LPPHHLRLFGRRLTGKQETPSSGEQHPKNRPRASPTALQGRLGPRLTYVSAAIAGAKHLPSCQSQEEHPMADTFHKDETRELIASNKIEGTAVYDLAGERLGSITNFMVDKRSGKVDYAVMQFGGFLGIGADYYPIPWQMLNYSTDHGGYVVDLDKDTLADAPRYADNSNEPDYDQTYNQQVYSHYGVTY
jgi:hypothetical protein